MDLGPAGLTEAEAARRRRDRGRVRRSATSRSYLSIVRANTLTVFNLILVSFGVLTLAFGDWRDALFLGILIANTAIGITQEVRAKRQLDSLALLVRPQAVVVRDGERRTVAPEELVEGDLVLLAAGDQLVADGTVVGARDLRVDESILTGEPEPVAREAGQELRSGAFVAEGSGSMQVTAVGSTSYAERLLGQARAFRHPRSHLELAINRLLLWLVGAVVLLGGLLGYSLWDREADGEDAVATATAGVVTLVPEGLVLLLSLTYAVAAARMARRGVLSQQINAIESLCSADVICFDKTGTLTDAELRVTRTVPAQGVASGELERMLARYAAAATLRNGTVEAIASAFPDEGGEEVAAEVPFASRRRWSGVQLGDATLVLGAPELFDLGGLVDAVDRASLDGRRVVAIGRSPAPLGEGDDPPSDLRLLGVVTIAERLRPDAREAVRFFADQGIDLKVLSGDRPETAAAIAADAGIAVDSVLTGDLLPADPEELRAAVERASVIGRISPEDKQRVVEALRDAGRYVAMIGDGVNDVPALKASRLAIAQGGGSQMAKGVADLVLVNGDFTAVPAMVAEGRQALRNLQRVARLYVTKSSFAAFLILTIGITSTAYPLLPRHLSLVAALTIGIPTFFLALAPSSGKWQSDSFERDVARFAIPAGVITGTGVVSSYLFALHSLERSLLDARTVATTVLMAVGFYLVIALELDHLPARRRPVEAMCAALAAVYVAVLVTPPLRDFFELGAPTLAIVLVSLGGSALSIGALALAGFPERPEQLNPSSS